MPRHLISDMADKHEQINRLPGVVNVRSKEGS